MVCTNTTLTLLPFTLGLSLVLVQWVQDILPLEERQVEYEADPLPMPTAEVKNARTYTSTNEPYILMEKVYMEMNRHCDNCILKQ